MEIGDNLYRTLKLLHILGVVGFLGGLVTALYWKLGADRTGDAGFVARVHQRLRKADDRIIGPSALVTFAAGYIMVRGVGERIATTPFALWGLILMFLALGLWYLGMRRLQAGLAEEAESARAANQPLSRDYAKKSAAWVMCAFGAIALVVLVAILMIFRIPGA